ncbi:MAG: hypothetical protein WEA11_05045 [Acidimicrobiales bacterium]
MHPVERLRYVARATGYPQSVIVAETARALASYASDPQGLVTACRRVVQRQPGSAPLVWLCARLLCAGDPYAEIRTALEELENDTTSVELAHSLPEDATVVVLGWPELIGAALPRRGDIEVLVVDVLQEGGGLVMQLVEADVNAVDVPLAGLGSAVADADLVLLEASAVAPSEFLGIAGSLAAASVAQARQIPVWAVAGVGRFLPQRMWEPVRARIIPDDPWEGEDEAVPLSMIDKIVGPTGPLAVVDALRRTDCPVATELFKGDII